jgi:hypothetical protein
MASHQETPRLDMRFKIAAPLYPHVGLASGGQHPVSTSVRDAPTPQLASTDGHCPESARWLDLKSQGCWFESSPGSSHNGRVAPVSTGP